MSQRIERTGKYAHPRLGLAKRVDRGAEGVWVVLDEEERCYGERPGAHAAGEMSRGDVPCPISP
jgi:hypothetical protein